MKKNLLGFTLFELMVVMTIIAVLAGVVYPSYSESVKKEKRREAQQALADFAKAMEQWKLKKASYCDAGGVGGANSCGQAENDTGSPVNFAKQAPVSGGNATYMLMISAVTPTGYTLSAVPTGAQKGDKCGIFTLDSRGVKGLAGRVAEHYSVANCWY